MLRFFMTAGDTAQSGGLFGGPYMIIMLVVFIAIFYFMILRPENKKKKEQENLRNSLHRGDKITTIGGINVYTGSTNVVIEDCTVQGTKYYAVCAQSGSDVTIKNSVVGKNTDSSVATKIMFWTQAADKDSDMATVENPTGAFGASSITLESGTYTKNADGVFYSGVKPVVIGGTFNFDPSACVDTQSYDVIENAGVWTVSAK